jgi:hypothetical protein
MSAFTRLLGQPYLDQTIRPLVRDILSDDPDTYEVDPNKAERSVEENMSRLLSVCQQMLDVILTSLPFCPAPFRVAAKHLQVFSPLLSSPLLSSLLSSPSLLLFSFSILFCFGFLFFSFTFLRLRFSPSSLAFSSQRTRL